MESTVLDSTLTEIAEMLRVILGEEGFDLPITMDTTFFGDLGMASIDLVALGGRLHSRYGPSLNFAQFIASLDAGSAVDLPVGRLVEHVVAACAPGTAGG